MTCAIVGSHSPDRFLDPVRRAQDQDWHSAMAYSLCSPDHPSSCELYHVSGNSTDPNQPQLSLVGLFFLTETPRFVAQKKGEEQGQFINASC